MNDKPCKECKHCDPIVVGDGTRNNRHAWCAAKSEYPAQEALGQVFPAGVRRVAPGELARPVIVVASDVVKHCDRFRSVS